MTSLVRATCEGSAPEGRIFRITQPHGLRIRHLGTLPVLARGKSNVCLGYYLKLSCFATFTSKCRILFYSAISSIRADNTSRRIAELTRLARDKSATWVDNLETNPEKLSRLSEHAAPERGIWKAGHSYIVIGRWVHHVGTRVSRTGAIGSDRCCPRPAFEI